VSSPTEIPEGRLTTTPMVRVRRPRSSQQETRSHTRSASLAESTPSTGVDCRCRSTQIGVLLAFGAGCAVRPVAGWDDEGDGREQRERLASGPPSCAPSLCRACRGRQRQETGTQEFNAADANGVYGAVAHAVSRPTKEIAVSRQKGVPKTILAGWRGNLCLAQSVSPPARAI
jgi:hypothetical protein